MSGASHNRPIQRFGLFAQPTPYRGQTRPCTLIGASVLCHSADKKAVAETVRTDTGVRVLLCDHCRSYVEAYHWAASQGLVIGSETLLYALALVWRYECGYTAPIVQKWQGSRIQLSHLSHNLKALCGSGHLQRIDGRYLLHDACPACYRRGGCDKKCMLHMGEDFAQRREAQL